MPLELIIFCAALLPVLFRAVMGWRFGATFEMRHALAALFAVLVALRYWYQVAAAVTDFLPLDPQYVAAGIFVVLFFVAWLFAALIFNLKGEVFQSVSPNYLDNALGALSGVLSGAIWGCSLLAILAIALPGKAESFDSARFPARLDRLPAEAFRWVEQNVAGIPAGSKSRTPFPQIVPSEDAAQKQLFVAWK